MAASWVTRTRVRPSAGSSVSSCEHFRPRSRVQVSRRLVGEEELGLVHQGPRERGALRFAARELARFVRGPLQDSEPFEKRVGSRLPLRLRPVAVGERRLDVLPNRHLRNEIERLEEEADGPVPKPALRAVVERAGILPVQQDPAAGGKVEAADEVQERRLTRARTAHHRDEASSLDPQAHGIERDNLLPGPNVDAAGLDGFDECRSNLFRRIPQHRVAIMPEFFGCVSRGSIVGTARGESRAAHGKTGSQGSRAPDSAEGATTSRKPGTLSPPRGRPSSEGSPSSTSSPASTPVPITM